MLFCPRPSTSAAADSEIEHQPVALAAGAADHDLGVRGLLLLGQNGVAVLGGARDHALLTCPTDTELARIIDVHTAIEQDLEDAFPFRDDEFLARARELDHE